MKLKRTLANIAINGAIAGFAIASHWYGQDWAGNVAVAIAWTAVPLGIMGGFVYACHPLKKGESVPPWIVLPASLSAFGFLAADGWVVTAIAYLLTVAWVNAAISAGEAQSCRNS